MNWTINQTVDLSRGYTPVVWPDALMVSGDVGAHTWRLTVLDNGVPADLSDATITGSFLRADGNTVTVAGYVSGNVAIVTLTDVCYAVEGKMKGTIKMTKSGAVITLAAVIFTVSLFTSGSVIDPGVAYADFQIDASPKGVYADLDALNADPSADVSKIYITLNDGKWCYFNGAAWVAGGVYQTVKLAKKSVSSDKMDSFLSNTLFNADNLNNVPTDLLAGQFYDIYGILRTGASYLQSTGLIPVSPTKKYSMDNLKRSNDAERSCAITWFDNLGNFIGGTGSPEMIENGYGEAPNNAAFARFLYYTDTEDNIFVYEYDKLINKRIDQVDGIIGSTNLFDGTVDLAQGTFYDINGNLVTYDYSPWNLIQSTNLIPVVSGIKYTADNIYKNQEYSSRTSAITWFDKDGNFLSTTETPAMIEQGYGVAPENAAYARFIYYTDISASIRVYLYDGLYSIVSKIGGLPTSKQPYQSGNIYFSVEVNQTFADNTSITTTENDSETLENVPCVLKLPPAYSPTGKPTKLIMCAHGAGSYVTSSTALNFDRWSGLVDAGYAVFDVNGGKAGSTYGQHVSGVKALECYFKAYQFLIENYNFEKTIFVTGASMGGITALNFTNKFNHIVDVIGVLYPVTDLYNQAWLNPWTGDTKQRLAEEYNFVDKSGTTWEADKVVGYSPIANNSFTIETEQYNYYPRPLKIWHGTADTVVSYEGSQKLVQAIKNSGGIVDFRTMDGVGHTQPSIFIPELVIYFNRFLNK